MRNSHEFSIREYRPTDREGCVSVFETNLPKFFQPEELAEFKQFLEELPGPYLVMVDTEGIVAGCGGYALLDGSETADLCWGMVRQGLHGQGLGRRLTKARIEGARRDLSVSRIALHTSQHTRGFYEEMGFRMTEMRRDGYGPGLHRCDMLLVFSEEDGGP